MQTFETVTVGANVSKELSAAFYAQGNIKMNKAFISVEAAPLRFRVDGVDPTTTVGNLAGIGDDIELQSADEIKKFRAIRTTGVSATLSVTYRVKDE